MKKVIFVLFPLLLTTACEENSPSGSSYDSNITINNYGAGAVCGGAVLSLNDKVYRSFEGGVASLDEGLNINTLDKIGNFDHSQVYHVEVIDGDLWFSLTNYSDFNEVRVLDDSGEEIASYGDVGVAPGDFAKWTSGENSWVFVANEGNLGSTNGSITMINQNGETSQLEAVGDIVQSLEVYQDKLIVLVNNSHMIKIYSITEDGLNLPGIEVSTDNSSPREMEIVNDKIYFTNWDTQDVKVFNLFNYAIEESIPVGTLPEGIISDGLSLWVANSGEDTVSEITLSSLNEIKYEVGTGPQNITIHDGDIYISRTYYDESWNAFHGSSKIEF